MFIVNDVVRLSSEAAENRIPEMKRATGIVVNFPVPNDRWVAVKWKNKEMHWTELKENLVKI